MEFSREMTVHTFHHDLWLPTARHRVFAFFADARNLEAITPPWLKFEILTPGTIQIRAGTRIDHRLRLRRWPISWQTEITVWDPTRCFVDEQRRGPYRHWRHTHTFSDLDGGTLCRDDIEYAVPGGPLINWLFVRRDIEQIFAYRARALSRQYPPGG
jgi:ligand-binding SRPBCC domain-containing protein